MIAERNIGAPSVAEKKKLVKMVLDVLIAHQLSSMQKKNL